MDPVCSKGPIGEGREGRRVCVVRDEKAVRVCREALSVTMDEKRSRVKCEQRRVWIWTRRRNGAAEGQGMRAAEARDRRINAGLEGHRDGCNACSSGGGGCGQQHALSMGKKKQRRRRRQEATGGKQDKNTYLVMKTSATSIRTCMEKKQKRTSQTTEILSCSSCWPTRVQRWRVWEGLGPLGDRSSFLLCG